MHFYGTHTKWFKLCWNLKIVNCCCWRRSARTALYERVCLCALCNIISRSIQSNSICINHWSSFFITFDFICYIIMGTNDSPTHKHILCVSLWENRACKTAVKAGRKRKKSKHCVYDVFASINLVCTMLVNQRIVKWSSYPDNVFFGKIVSF